MPAIIRAGKDNTLFFTLSYQAHEYTDEPDHFRTSVTEWLKFGISLTTYLLYLGSLL